MTDFFKNTIDMKDISHTVSHVFTASLIDESFKEG